MKQQPLFPNEKLQQQEKAPIKQGALFNKWLKENIKNMKSNRFINIWNKINKIVSSDEEIVAVEEYLKSEIEKDERYNYFLVMLLLDEYKDCVSPVRHREKNKSQY